MASQTRGRQREKQPLRDYAKRKILIIDDSKRVLQSMTELLADLGLKKVSVAADGVLGLKLAVQEEPELIFLDIEMPQLNGWELLNKLREHKSTARVIMLSAHDDAESGLRAAQMGATDYVAKNRLHDVIEIKIRNALAFGLSINANTATTVLRNKVVELSNELTEEGIGTEAIQTLNRVAATLALPNPPFDEIRRDLTFVESALANASGNVIAATLVAVAVALAASIH